jgi:hypothetical protein
MGEESADIDPPFEEFRHTKQLDGHSRFAETSPQRNGPDKWIVRASFSLSDAGCGALALSRADRAVA